MGILNKLSNFWDKVVLEPTITTEELIEQIHNEFNTAGDQLLLEAQEFLKSIDIKETNDKAVKLERLGFTNTPELKEKKELQTKSHSAKDLSDKLQNYALSYPQYKIINLDKVKEICKKYNLVYGEVSRYKGFVPKKNLEEISNFRLKEEDYKYFYEHRGWDEVIRRYTNKRAYDQQQEDYGIKHVWVSSAVDHSYREVKGRFYGNNLRPEDRIRVEKESFLICAPIKDMDISNMEVKDFQLVKKHIPDPVVLQPLKDDLFIIITAWGDEASDPLVVNHKNN